MHRHVVVHSRQRGEVAWGARLALPHLNLRHWLADPRNRRGHQLGKKDEAFAFLVEKTIPAHNALLGPLALKKRRQGERLQFRVREVMELSALDRGVVIGSVLVVAAGQLGMTGYLDQVTQKIGTDPDQLKRVADAMAQGDLSVAIDLKPGDTTSTMAALHTRTQRLAEQ